jgi:2-keto-myo-inositol isomerase
MFSEQMVVKTRLGGIKLSGYNFALNHMCAPSLPLSAFFALGRRLGLSRIEIRNDLAGNAILDGTLPAEVKAAATSAGVEISTINALQKFNHWDDKRAAEADALATYAAACGAKALVLVPNNDGSGRANGERQANLRIALKALTPILERHNLIGLVEPLGFESCSLRLKSEAVDAIISLKLEQRFRLVHDTFHHHVAGEEALFPEHTGLVHISGVTDPRVSIADMRDSHRVLVTASDRIGNAAQIAALILKRPDLLLSFEPFSDAVHASKTIEADLKDSMNFITGAVGAAA